jgi:hypothetical protein
MGVHDLNFGLHICDAFGFKRPGVTHERGQDTVCASDGVRAVEDLRTYRRAPQWRRRCAHLGLRRFVSRAGLRAIDVARVLARHRGLPDSQSGQAFSHGIEGRACPLDAVGCIEPSGLAHLSCTGDAADCACQETLRQRAAGHRPRRNRLCTGCDHHRPVPESVRLGTVSFDQGRFPPSFTSATARCTKSTCWTSCLSKRVLFM